MEKTIKHENILKSKPGAEEPGYNYYQFVCQGCEMENRKDIWNGFVSSISSVNDGKMDNSYLTLVEEPNNSGDQNAIMVVCCGEFSGTVGYVGKEYIQEVKKILDECISYRLDMIDEEVGEQEVNLMLTWQTEKDLRKVLGLPITKKLRFMRKVAGKYEEFGVSVFKIVDTYMPSGMHSLAVTLVDGSQERILAPFFAHMQKSSFEQDMEKIPEEEEKEK